MTSAIKAILGKDKTHHGKQMANKRQQHHKSFLSISAFCHISLRTQLVQLPYLKKNYSINGELCSYWVWFCHLIFWHSHLYCSCNSLSYKALIVGFAISKITCISAHIDNGMSMWKDSQSIMCESLFIINAISASLLFLLAY